MPETIPAAPQAASPAPHQIAAFTAAKLQATVVTILGLIVTAGGALVEALTSTQLVSPHSQYIVIAGAIITVAGRLEAAIAHASFQSGTGA